jgi:CubicO group peptidase (beta-lactamase class C family)
MRARRPSSVTAAAASAALAASIAAVSFATPVRLAAQAPHPLPATDPAAPLAGFDAYAEKARGDWRVPGMAVVVVKDDSVAFLRGFGVRELGTTDSVGPRTKFGIMSTTKAFTAMLVAMLADSGRVRLDDPVGRVVPEFRLADPYASREVTVRDLLTHRVGFGDPYYLWAAPPANGFPEIVRRLGYVPRETSLRSRFAYNNVAYAVAGEVAARAGGAPWAELLRRRILDPLGMADTYADGASLRASGARDVTAPHAIVDDTVRVIPAGERLVDPVAPAGAAFSSAADLARWMRFLLDSARVDGRRLLSADRYAELFAPQAIVPPAEFYPTARLTRPRFTAYGLGWFLHDYRGRFVAFHTGSIDGRSAIVGLIPDLRLGVAVLTNLDHSELRHALMYAAFDRYLDAGGAPGAGRDWSAELRALYGELADSSAARRARREARRVAGTRPSLPLARYAATYADSLFGTATVREADGGLVLQAGEETGTLEHWHHDVFRVRWANPFQGREYLSFALDADGTAGELRFVDRGWRMRRRP